MKKSYELKGKVWKYQTANDFGSWHFIGIDKKISEEIKKGQKGPRRGFGSVKVEVTVGKTKWLTSIFPDKRSGTYILPLKSSVRKKEGIVDGKDVLFSIKLMS